MGSLPSAADDMLTEMLRDARMTGPEGQYRCADCWREGPVRAVDFG